MTHLPLVRSPARATVVLAVALACAGLGQAVRAQPLPAPPQTCPEAWVDRLRPARSTAQAGSVERVLGSHCRAFPGDASRHVAALVYAPHETEGRDAASGQRGPLTLVLAVASPDGTKVLQRYEQEIEEDASVELNGANFTWDPAVYRLAPGVLALGLRFDNAARGASCPDQRWGQELTLLVPDGAALRPVFSAAMHVQVGIGGALCGNAPKWSRHERVLAVDRANPAAWADLLLIDRVTVESPDTQGPARRFTARWRYDGRRYVPLPASTAVDALGEVTVVRPMP